MHVLRYVCRKCGYVLVEWDPDKLKRDGDNSLRYHGVPEPYYVIDTYKGVCPKCGAKLGIPRIEDVTVRLVG